MNWYTFAFAPIMIVAPLIFAAFARFNAQAGGDRALVRTRMIRLVIATAVAFAVFIALYLILDLWDHGVWAAHAWPLFFPLFFGFAMPVIAAKNPDTVTPHPKTPVSVRSASLVSRERRNPLRLWHWAICWIICGIAIVGVIARPIVAPISDDAERWRIMSSILLIVVLWAPMLALLPWCMRMVLREPEPLDAAGSHELAAAYERHRNFKLWCFWWFFGIVMNVLIGSGALMTAWTTPGESMSRSLGVFGGVGGALLGVAGAAFGIYAGIQRVRITALLRELNQRQPR